MASMPCLSYGSYANTSSSTARFFGDDFSDFLSNLATGSFITDTLTFGGHTFDSLEFGTYDQVGAHFTIPSPDAAILGKQLTRTIT